MIFQKVRDMKKRLVKIMCAVMALMMALLPCTAAMAKNEVVPVIVVHGLGGNDLYQNIGTDEQSMIPAYGLDAGSMLTNPDILGEAVKLFSNEKKPNYKKLFKALGTYFKSTNINCDKNGNVKDGQGIINYWEDSMAHHKEYYSQKDYSEPVITRQIAKIIGNKKTYAFNYDWRVDVVETAKNLRKMIVKIKKKTGAKKVSLVGISLGGAVLSSYMDMYKSKNDVARYVFVNPAIQGVDVARLLEKDIVFDTKTVLSFLKFMEQGYDGGSKATLFKAIYALGDERLKIAVKNLNKLAKNEKQCNAFFKKVLKPWLGNIPAYWECIPYGEFNKCINAMAKIGFIEKGGKLHKKLKRYHAVQGRFTKNVKYLKKKGAQIAIIANYGIPGIPATSKCGNHTDVLIDTKYASAGATVAPYGKTLKGKNAKGKYVSPDKVINAKTCALPDSTWFVKGILHTMFKADTKATKFIANLATGQVKISLKAVKKKYGYTQFLDTDANQKLTNIKK